MDSTEFEIASVRFRDLIAVSRMTHENMVGADREFTRLVESPGGRLLSNLFLPWSLLFAGSGYKATHGGSLVGCAYVALKERSGYVFNVLVHRQYRRLGAGSLLMNRLESVVRERARGWLTLQVDHDNEPARKLYESLGYRAYHPEFYRGQAAELDLDAASGTISLNYERPTVGRRLYAQYQALECEKGDTWALDAVGEIGQPADNNGDFYSCLVEDSIVGCVQLILKQDRLRLELLLDPAQWGNWFTVRAASQLLADQISRVPAVEVNLGSSQHHHAARSRLQDMGFRSCGSSRYFMAKRLEREDGVKPGI